MVNAGEEFPHIALQHETILSSEHLVSIDGRVSSLAFATGIAVTNECAVIDWFQDIAKGMVDNPIPVWSGADQARFGIGDRKASFDRRSPESPSVFPLRETFGRRLRRGRETFADRCSASYSSKEDGIDLTPDIKQLA